MSAQHGGLAAQLGIRDKLLECVIPGEPAVEYGVVEDRLFERYPTEAGTLLRRYGHKWRDPEHPSGRFSMSVYLAARLSELAGEGHLVKTFDTATGPWSYNGVISYWRTTGPESAPAEPLQSTPAMPVSTDDLDRLAEAARILPPAEGDYTETDYVMNLFETVLDYQMHTTTVVKALEYFRANRWDEIRTLEDLEERFKWHPDTQAGNTAMAKALWGNKHWTRAHQLRDLTAFFRSIGVTDQPALEAWAEEAELKRDFRGRVKGLGPAVFQWLVMRQGIDTVKLDVHVRPFAEGALGRPIGDVELIDLIEQTAERLELPARELDWRIWEASRGGGLDYPG